VLIYHVPAIMYLAVNNCGLMAVRH